MTRDEVLLMKPGRELDALIAKNVFKINIPDNRYRMGLGKRGSIVEVDQWTGVLHYSSFVENAWKVVDALSKNVGLFYVWQHVDYASASCGGGTVYAKTAPEAICKAALLAIIG